MVTQFHSAYEKDATGVPKNEASTVPYDSIEPFPLATDTQLPFVRCIHQRSAFLDCRPVIFFEVFGHLYEVGDSGDVQMVTVYAKPQLDVSPYFIGNPQSICRESWRFT